MYVCLRVSVVDVNTDNGCMFVIPRENDRQFGVDAVPKDQDPFSHRFPYEDIKPLAPAAAGAATPYGGACSALICVSFATRCRA